MKAKSKHSKTKKIPHSNSLAKKYFMFTGLSVLILLAGIVFFIPQAEEKTKQNAPLITVYKSPTCACCNKWVNHLKANGFNVDVNNSRNMAKIKAANGIPAELQSCHTAFVNGYLIEGHVPAKDIKTLLKQKPTAIGLSVPGMPMGSPGMEGNRNDPYAVLLMKKDNTTTTFAQY